MERHNPSRHPRAGLLLTRVLFCAHVVYYGATAGGFHLAHSVAAGSVLMLLLVGALLGVSGE